MKAFARYKIYCSKSQNEVPVIAGTDGLRKLRLALPGRGKRGGARVIYYWQNDQERIFLILIYPKGAKEDLTPKEKIILKQLVKELS